MSTRQPIRIYVGGIIAMTPVLATPVSERGLFDSDKNGGMSSSTKIIILIVCVVAAIFFLSLFIHFFSNWFGCGGRQRMKAGAAMKNAYKTVNTPSARPANQVYYNNGQAYYEHQAQHSYMQQQQFYEQQQHEQRQRDEQNQWHQQHYG